MLNWDVDMAYGVYIVQITDYPCRIKNISKDTSYNYNI